MEHLNNLFFNDYGISKKINGNIDLSSIKTIIGVGHHNIFKVMASYLDCITDVVIVKCKDREYEIDGEINPCLKKYKNTEYGKSCLSNISYNEAFFNIYITDTNNIPKFKVLLSSTEILEFSGGDYLELEQVISSYGFDFISSGNGYIVYVDNDYAGSQIEVKPYSTEVFVVNENVCINKNEFKGLSLCIHDQGCYKIVLYNKSHQVSVSNSIQVIDYEPNDMTMVDFVSDGIYQRRYLPIQLYAEYPEVTGDAITTSDGKTSYSDTTIKTISEFMTSAMNHKYHQELILILRSGIKINQEKWVLGEEYSKSRTGLNGNYTAHGLIENNSQLITNTSECGSNSCGQTSHITIKFFDKQRINNTQLQEI